MATELRKIMLNAEEILAALRAFRAAHPERIPPGEILGSRCDDDCVTIELHDRDDFGPKSFDHRLSYDTMREVLIRFCLENNIPLPMRGRKSLARAAGNLILEIRIEDELLTGVNYSTESLSRFKASARQAILQVANARA